jgi:signal recognition particle receptor subunit beta
MDYGEIGVNDEEKIRMYGIPGQRRFDFMWRILRDRAEGMVLLVHNDGPDPVNAMREYMIEFADLCERGGVAVGVTRMDVGPIRRRTRTSSSRCGAPSPSGTRSSR